MKWIGLTGGIASGKSTVASGLRSRGFEVLDADEMARRVVLPGSPGLKKIVQVFGPELLTSKGDLDRVKLGKQVFSDPKKRMQIEKITHPLIRELSLKERKRLEEGGHQIAFYDVPLLFEKNMEAMFDSVVLVMAREDLQRERIAKRNGLSTDEIGQRLKAQIPLKDKISKADFVILNEGSLQDLEKSIDSFLKAAGYRLPRP